jgi:hypothetical protein
VRGALRPGTQARGREPRALQLGVSATCGSESRS